MTITAFSDELAQVRTKKKEFLILNSMPFRRLKSFLKILIGVHMKKKFNCSIKLISRLHFPLYKGRKNGNRSSPVLLLLSPRSVFVIARQENNIKCSYHNCFPFTTNEPQS